MARRKRAAEPKGGRADEDDSERRSPRDEDDNEKRGIHPHPTSLFDGFNSALEDCGLFDLRMCGRRYTWERGKGTDNWVEESLDRAMAGVDWCSLFPQASVQNYDILTSDHTTIFVEFEGPEHARRREFSIEGWIIAVCPLNIGVVDLLNARRVRLRISIDA
nr:uncharacterized protein LOC109166477 [Ipomoea batatas]